MLKRQALRCFRASCERCGFSIARRSDYYSPLPSEFALCKTRPRWAKPSSLKGVVYELEVMKRRLKELRDSYLSEFLTLPPYQSLVGAGYGLGYPQVDAFTLYAMVRQVQPSRYIEGI